MQISPFKPLNNSRYRPNKVATSIHKLCIDDGFSNDHGSLLYMSNNYTHKKNQQLAFTTNTLVRIPRDVERFDSSKESPSSKELTNDMTMDMFTNFHWIFHSKSCIVYHYHYVKNMNESNKSFMLPTLKKIKINWGSHPACKVTDKNHNIFVWRKIVHHIK